MASELDLDQELVNDFTDFLKDSVSACSMTCIVVAVD